MLQQLFAGPGIRAAGPEAEGIFSALNYDLPLDLGERRHLGGMVRAGLDGQNRHREPPDAW
jgi:hypothetical protein